MDTGAKEKEEWTDMMHRFGTLALGEVSGRILECVRKEWAATQNGASIPCRRHRSS